MHASTEVTQLRKPLIQKWMSLENYLLNRVVVYDLRHKIGLLRCKIHVYKQNRLSLLFVRLLTKDTCKQRFLNKEVAV